MPLPFSELQRQIGRKAMGKKLLQEVPTAFLAYDVLEIDGDDLRVKPLLQRRKILSHVLSSFPGSRLIINRFMSKQ